jgi:hypothetical protein
MRRSIRTKRVGYKQYLNTIHNMENKGFHLEGLYRTETPSGLSQKILRYRKKAAPEKINKLMNHIKSKYKNIKKINMNGTMRVYAK